MRISYNWLKDYIDLNMAPERLAELLTMAGISTDAIHKTEDDHIFEIEVTSNRPDWLSYVGIARELAAITGSKLKLPKTTVKGQGSRVRGQGLKVKVEESGLCPRYTARIIRNLKVGESSERLKKRLEAMNLRTVNNVVDITNFCLFETGEPMHAFDLDKIEGREVVIRKARKGERIVTIDGIERELNDSVLVIADHARPIAIAGVMGGLNTEVTGSTKNILLEAASFDQISVRRTARALGISTESSYRFERKVDLNNITNASNRAASLIRESASGEVGELTDIGKRYTQGKTITLRLSRLNSILGLGIPASTAKKIINALGLDIKKSSKDKIIVETPPQRYDLNAEIDIIEEVARIYGYGKIPSTIPAIVEQDEKMPFGMIAEKRIREVLTGLGADEIITYSLLGRNVLKAAGMEHAQVPEIKNPLSSEQEVMRPSLMPGMLSAILWNVNRKSKDLKLFEFGKIYIQESEAKFSEKKYLSIGIAGEISSWAEGSRKCGFFDLKGAIEIALSEVGISGLVFKEARSETYSHSCAALIELGGEAIGTAGEVAKRVLGNFDIKEAVYFCEVSLETILKHANLKKRFKELPKYPSVYKEVLNSELVSLVRNTAGEILREIKLIDRYAGKQIPDGKVSLTYRLEYWDPSKTLEEKDVSSAHSKLIRALEEKYGARLR